MKPKTYEVVLLDEEEHKSDKSRLREELILANFYLDVNPEDNEMAIREKLTKLFRKTFPLTTPNMFNFMKCNRTLLTDPGVPETFEWNYEHLKKTFRARKTIYSAHCSCYFPGYA